MSMYPCANCGQRVKGRLATFYNAWFNEQGERVCFKQRLCAACVMSVRGSLLGSVSDESSSVSVCPDCGNDSAERLNPLYLTVYLPKQEPKEFALPTCQSCGKKWQELLSANAEQMVNRENTGGGLGTAEWEAIEL